MPGDGGGSVWAIGRPQSIRSWVRDAAIP